MRNFDERKKTFSISNVRPSCFGDHDDSERGAFMVEQSSGAPLIVFRAAGIGHRMTVEDARAMARALADATQHAVLWGEEK